MGDNDKVQKRGAPGDKGGYNPINTGKPEEYICVVGAPSNTFNGYFYYDPGTHTDIPCAHPKNVPGVPKYLKGPDPAKPAGTHDLYWANFIDPAMRLFANKIAQPKPGDIVTIMVCFPGYIERNRVDWDASPYNLALHRDSPWVKNDPDYNGRPKSTTPDSPASPVAPAPPSRPPARPSGTTTPPTTKSHAGSTDPEFEIDHDIFMRTTSKNEPARNIIKRPMANYTYTDYIHDVPKRLVFGPMLYGKPKIENILFKLLLFETGDQALDYMTTGAWTGQRWIHLLDTRSEEDMALTAPWPEGTYDFSMAATDKKIKWPDWMKPPAIDRKKVKIRRLDYFGHSAYAEFFLKYGLDNDKGALPVSEVLLTSTDMAAKFKADMFTKDAFSQLWGCFLGVTMAPALTPYFKEIVACDLRTNFEKILHNDSNMPEPMPGAVWKTHKKK